MATQQAMAWQRTPGGPGRWGHVGNSLIVIGCPSPSIVAMPSLTPCVSEGQPASWSYHTLDAKVLTTNLNTTPRHLTIPSSGQGLAYSTVVAARGLLTPEDSPQVTWQLKTRRS